MKIPCYFAFTSLLIYGVTSFAQPLPEHFKYAGQDRFWDTQGNRYEKFLSRNDLVLQPLIDRLMKKIAYTSLGQQILKNILGCDISAIEVHLGVSQSLAHRLSSSCQNWRFKTSHPWIAGSPKESIKKLSLFTNQKRQYVLVITDSSPWPYTSWTSSNTNQTFLLIRKGKDESNFTESYLAQLLAHELFIYFDSKFWAGSQGWKSLPYFQGLKFTKNKPIAVYSSLNNPLFAYALASLRAFQAEKQVINELYPNNQLYPEKDFEFLYDCHQTCVHKFVNLQVKNSLKYSLPFVSFSPGYRHKKLLYLNSTDYLPNKNIIKSLLVDLSRKFLKYYDINRSPFYAMITPEAMPASDFTKATDIMKDILLPQEKNLLKQNKVYRPNEQPLNIFNFMKKPLLSGYNVNISSGPRPRIRSGNTVVK